MCLFWNARTWESLRDFTPIEPLAVGTKTESKALWNDREKKLPPIDLLNLHSSSGRAFLEITVDRVYFPRNSSLWGKPWP